MGVGAGRTRSIPVILLSALIIVAGWVVAAPAGASSLPAQWKAFRHVPGVVDVAGPLSDGALVVAANGRLLLLSPTGTLTAFARGPHGYAVSPFPESYIAISEHDAVTGTSCSFPADATYAIKPGAAPQVIEVSAQGRSRVFANIPAPAFLNGIAFDTTGTFGHRLLVTSTNIDRTTVYSIDCAGEVSRVTVGAPRIEGGIAVAPSGFGHFGGDLIAADEHTGWVYAISPNGTSETVVRSTLPTGSDIGTESVGFVPPAFDAQWAAYYSDLLEIHKQFRGSNELLQMKGTALLHAGVRPGDLLVATEGGGKTILVRCTSTCSMRYIANGLLPTHGEGHISFAPVG